MFNRGTWLFSVLLVCMNVTAFALRPFFRFAARRAPVTKSLARKFSGIFFSAKEEVGNKTGAKDILVSNKPLHRGSDVRGLIFEAIPHIICITLDFYHSYINIGCP
jgi:hypothetical protein